MENNPQSISRKVIIVGSSGVGKTSLINRYLGHKFENKLYPTVSPSYLLKSIAIDEKHRVDLNIWDTAGQEQYQDIGKAFYHGSDIGVVCFDSNPLNMEAVPKWVDRIRQQVQDCCIFLAATKYDIISQDQDSVYKINSFSKEKVNELNLAGFYATSAKDNIGIDDLFDEIARIELTNKEKNEKIDIDSENENNKCNC